MSCLTVVLRSVICIEGCGSIPCLGSCLYLHRHSPLRSLCRIFLSSAMAFELPGLLFLLPLLLLLLPLLEFKLLGAVLQLHSCVEQKQKVRHFRGTMLVTAMCRPV